MVVPHSGQPTETFIRRYCEQLAPGNTVLVHFYRGADAWVPDCPAFFLQDTFFGSAKLARIYRGFQKALGIGSLFGDPYTASSLKRFLRINNVSVVFSQYLLAAWNIHHIVKSMGLRHVVRGHGFDLSATLDDRVWRERYHDLVSADAIVVPTPFQIQRLCDIGMDRHNIVSMPCGIDIPEIGPRKKWGGKSVFFLFVGRLVPKKGPLLLAEAFLQACEQNSNMRLIIGGDGPLYDDLKAFLDTHLLGDRVQLLGRLSHSEVLQKMCEVDVYIQHSITDPVSGDQEGAPVAIIEAMGQGLPVVSTRHSGIPYLVEHEVTGLLSKENDVSGMAQNILKIAEDEGRREELGRRARSRARELSWDREKLEIQNILNI